MDYKLDFGKHDPHYIVHNLVHELTESSDCKYEFEERTMGPAEGSKVIGEGCEKGYRAKYTVNLPEEDITNIDVEFRILDSEIEVRPERIFAAILDQPSEHRHDNSEQQRDKLCQYLEQDLDNLVDSGNKEEMDLGPEKIIQYSWE